MDDAGNMAMILDTGGVVVALFSLTTFVTSKNDKTVDVALFA